MGVMNLPRPHRHENGGGALSQVTERRARCQSQGPARRPGSMGGKIEIISTELRVFTPARNSQSLPLDVPVLQEYPEALETVLKAAQPESDQDTISHDLPYWQAIVPVSPGSEKGRRHQKESTVGRYAYLPQRPSPVRQTAGLPKTEEPRRCLALRGAGRRFLTPNRAGGGLQPAGRWKTAALPSYRASGGTLWGKPLAKFPHRASRNTGNHAKSQARDHGRKVISTCLRNNAYPSAKPSTDSGVRCTVYAIS